jgi:hypothetical protein
MAPSAGTTTAKVIMRTMSGKKQEKSWACRIAP